ncbi:hypothetical protein XENOCAPTIV_020348 [Xenoophorus captivus]|uniref:Uncharacterized protein n=1 Tax=Xenoophorus captivus TaxID=1517983 RepID=A0ABV0QEV2_9TELE
MGKLVPISSSLWAGGRGHPGQIASPSQGNTQTTKHTLIHTSKGNLERPINLTGMSLDCGRKLENMQTPCRKTPGQKLNPRPSCCKATVLPLCHYAATVQGKIITKS